MSTEEEATIAKLESEDNTIENTSTNAAEQIEVTNEATTKNPNDTGQKDIEEEKSEISSTKDSHVNIGVVEDDEKNLQSQSNTCITAEGSAEESVVEMKQVLPQAQLDDKESTSKQTLKNDKYAENVTYTEDGSAIYTDPKTNYKYKWSEEQNNWLALDSAGSEQVVAATSTNPYENEHYKWCNEKQQWIAKAQITETEHYKWDAEKNEWVAKTAQAATSTEVANDIDELGQRIYTDKDGAVYFWDAEKSAWFPKIDDDFMARYQMNYGFIDNTSAAEDEKRLKAEQEEKRKAEELKRMAEEAKAAAAATTTAGVKRKVAQEPPKWFDLDPQHNTKVYVSNLPLDITLDEFAEIMGKCGMIMRDAQTQKHKLKLYTEADGQIKGDGLCDYIKVESVDLALNIIDGYDLRGNKLRVQRAEFQMRGEYNPALKPKRKKKDKEKLQKMKEKLFDWRPEKMRGERSKNEKVVIIKNLFHPEIFEKEVQLILDYQNDLREECSKCGSVRKIVIYDRHADGIAQVNMAEPEEADLVIQMMNGRFFGKRQLQAEHWDGKTKYKIAESDNETQKRLSNWSQFLDSDETKKDEEQKLESKSSADLE